MNSVQLANHAWQKVLTYSVITDAALWRALQSTVGEPKWAELPDYVITNATTRLRRRHEEMQAAIKALQQTPENWPKYQDILNRIRMLSGPIKE